MLSVSPNITTTVTAKTLTATTFTFSLTGLLLQSYSRMGSYPKTGTRGTIAVHLLYARRPSCSSFNNLALRKIMPTFNTDSNVADNQ